jgi:hypothetical protein
MAGLLQEAETTLIQLGIKHAPIHQCLDSTQIDGRYVMGTDPAGIYYLLGIDNGWGTNDISDNKVQLLFWGKTNPDKNRVQLDHIAQRLGWEVFEEGNLPVADPAAEAGMECFQAKLRPPPPQPAALAHEQTAVSG